MKKAFPSVALQWRDSVWHTLVWTLLLSSSCRAFVPSHSRGAVSSLLDSNSAATSRRLATVRWALSEREREIRLQIAKLKRQGKLPADKKSGNQQQSQKETANEYYQAKIRQKLGKGKSKLLGYNFDEEEDDDNEEYFDDDTDETSVQTPSISLGSTSAIAAAAAAATTTSSSPSRPPLIDPSLFERQDDDDDDDDSVSLSEKDLVVLVERKLLEKRIRERQIASEQQPTALRSTDNTIAAPNRSTPPADTTTSSSSSPPPFTTSGVGGTWSPSSNTNATTDLYQPKSGSWGTFPRPRDMSQAYGGGRRVGPGYSNEERKKQSEQATLERLQRYRERVGIDVSSEKEHADEINEALAISKLAMQRGVYSTAVSALEQVTKYCSTNSKVGGTVFLELAMAYEAVGRTAEAITVYRTLTTCRMEDIKYNAKRLLYGLEAIQFMRDDVRSKEFSRKKVKNTFIDTTGLANIASHFDDVYNTAYIDLEGSFYKRLTQSVVRSAREARQILLRATGAGEVDRLRIVQALRSLSRRFDDALQAELQTAVVSEPVAVMNGRPIQELTAPPAYVTKEAFSSNNNRLNRGNDEFVLADAKSMMENINGEWRLQLLADKRGDGVKYFNTTVAWQEVNMQSRTFSSSGQSGFITVQQEGNVEFNERKRILRRRSVQVQGGGVFSGLFGGSNSGAVGAIRTPQQIIAVDSVLLITRHVPSQRARAVEDEKDYFAVWRRVAPGTYTKARP